MRSRVVNTPDIRFGRMAPTLSVSDIDQSVGFYTRILGFTKVFENGSPVGFVILKRDGAELHLSLRKGHAASSQNVAHLMVQDAAVVYEHLESRGVRIVKTLRDATFGMRCFVFADLDGNRIDVGEVLEPACNEPPAPSDSNAGAVLYAKNLSRISDFYAGVVGFEVGRSEADHVVLESRAVQLVILSIPQDLASSIAIAAPPVRRTETPIKLVFHVRSISACRAAAAKLDGELNPVEREWRFGEFTVCDGHDPEGNVFQLREKVESHP